MTSNRPNDIVADVEPFVISREFDAPRDLMWELWSQGEHMKNWLTPKGFTMKTYKLDFAEGGVFHYCLQAPDSTDVWGKFVYVEIRELESIIWITSFSDPARKITRNPYATDWPLELLTTVMFEESDSKTTVHLEWIPINATTAEIEAFNQGRDGMKGGWTGTFELLDVYIKKQEGGRQ